MLLTAGAFAMTSCSDFLSRSPYDEISSEEFWKSEKDLELYATGFIQRMIPAESTITRGDANTDMCALSLATDLLRPDAVVSADNQTGWSENDWINLRRINYMLDNMSKCKGVVSDEVYNHYEGVARFWRAWFYYGKIRTFGSVPWYEHVIQSSDTEALYKGRDSREYVMDRILDDLNFAATNCSSSAEYTAGSCLVSKWVALAFKSRVCLFEGTYRKYHTVDPATQQPWDASFNENDKFLREAAAAAKEIMDDGPYSLVTGDVNTVYRSLFTSAALNTQEVIFGREYSQSLSVFHEASWVFFSPTYGSRISLVKSFIDTYLMADGTPFTSQDGYEREYFYNDATQESEFDNRDARLAQTIATPGYMQTNDGVTALYSPNWTVTRTGYQPIKWCLDSDEGGVYERAASWNSLPVIRYAEVLLNYAEAKAELGECDESVWNETIKLLRERAGVKSIYPTVADPYMQAYFLDEITDPVILEIRRERGCELCLEMGLRWDDLMRWHMGDILSSDNTPWKGIYVGNTSYSYDIDGDDEADFYMTSGGSETVNSIAIMNSGQNQSFSIDDDGNIVWEYKREWKERNYIRPIPTTAITRNPNLGQNELWK